jgi:hypothetical protein
MIWLAAFSIEVSDIRLLFEWLAEEVAGRHVIRG